MALRKKANNKSRLEKYRKLVAQQAKQIKELTDEIQKLKSEMKRLKELLEGKAESKAAKKPKFTENYSLDKNTRKKKDIRNQRVVVPRMPSET